MKRSINLFPARQLRHNHVRRLIYFWACVVLAVFVFGLMEYRIQQRRYNASESLLQNIERKVRPVRYMSHRSDVIVKELQVLADEAASKNGGQRLLTVLLAKVIFNIQASGDQVSIERLTFESFSQRQELKLVGIGISNKAIDDFAERLRAEKMFDEVKVSNKSNLKLDGFTVKRYELTCSF